MESEDAKRMAKSKPIFFSEFGFSRVGRESENKKWVTHRHSLLLKLKQKRKYKETEIPTL